LSRGRKGGLPQAHQWLPQIATQRRTQEGLPIDFIEVFSEDVPCAMALRLTPRSPRGAGLSLNHNFFLSEIGTFLRDEIDASTSTPRG
jgi:hypothetical protein